MNPTATLANTAWLASCLPAWRRFQAALLQPAEAQQARLRGLLTANAESAYGRTHRFSEIRSYQEFCRRVPIVHPEELDPWIARIQRGERGALVSEEVTRLVPTSGSSGGRKLIPFTVTFQKEINAAIAPWMVDLCQKHPSMPFGRAYWSISPAMPAAVDENSAVPIGFDDDSAYLGGFRQRLAEATFAVPSGLRRITDLASSRYLTLLCLLRASDLRLVSVWHPSFFTLLLDALPGCWELLLYDLATGDCRGAPNCPVDLRAAFTTTPQRRRADLLREVAHTIRTNSGRICVWSVAGATVRRLWQYPNYADVCRKRSFSQKVCSQPRGLLRSHLRSGIRSRSPRTSTNSKMRGAASCKRMN